MDIPFKWLKGGKEVQLVRPYSWEADDDTIIIPLRILKDENGFDQVCGFICDGGTIPPIFWPVVGHPFGQCLPAFVHHDYRWSFRNELKTDFAESNKQLYRDCRRCGAGVIKASAIWSAVSSAGWLVWKLKRNVGNVRYHYRPIS